MLNNYGQYHWLEHHLNAGFITSNAHRFPPSNSISIRIGWDIYSMQFYKWGNQESGLTCPVPNIQQEFNECLWKGGGNKRREKENRKKEGIKNGEKKGRDRKREVGWKEVRQVSLYWIILLKCKFPRLRIRQHFPQILVLAILKH